MRVRLLCSHIKTIGHYAFFTNDVYVLTKLNITCDLLVPLVRTLPMCSLGYGDFRTLIFKHFNHILCILSTNHSQFGILLIRKKQEFLAQELCRAFTIFYLQSIPLSAEYVPVKHRFAIKIINVFRNRRSDTMHFSPTMFMFSQSLTSRVIFLYR
jgi:hypothetical protein